MNRMTMVSPEKHKPPLLQRTSSMISVEDVPLLGWLSHAGPTHPKHRGWLHPLAVLLVHYFLAFSILLQLHDRLVDFYYTYYHAEFPLCHVDTTLQSRRNAAAVWLVFYGTIIFIWRLFFRPEPGQTKPGPAWPICYEYCWLCNISLWMGAWALYTGRPILASALCVTVGIDQLLWYVDLAGYALTGKFPVGVAKYLTWPQNANWSIRFTCTHHLWTIPLLLGASSTGTLHPLSCPLSFLCMTVNVVLSRWMVPMHLERPKMDTIRYLNVNLSHELWKDITFDILQINYDEPPAALYLFRLLWRWQGFNTIVFAILNLICWLVAGGEARIC